MYHTILHLLARAAIFTLNCHFYSTHSTTKISYHLIAVYNLPGIAYKWAYLGIFF
ncbi:hypothetical protein midi_00530 [Candidatus Midichloria mitochondrii IricVA]|uniref:Uncharacterized protein n=1 Tax=Midichloria mitochondrii (strain IricVA) TaxID=696127 RepID=F7XVY6_MIDMI|nr:hypothetical protein midi_00530 [Candidatus Midichloria mitochondrii IricVA]